MNDIVQPRRKRQPRSEQHREQLALAADRIIELQRENLSLRARLALATAPRRGLLDRLFRRAA